MGHAQLMELEFEENLCSELADRGWLYEDDGKPTGWDVGLAMVPADVEAHRSGWVRWAHWVAYHPWRSSIAATFVLLLLATPMLGMRLGQADAGTDPTSTTQRRAYDLLAADGVKLLLHQPRYSLFDRTPEAELFPLLSIALIEPSATLSPVSFTL